MKNSITDIVKAWDPNNSHVDASINTGKFLSSKTVLLVAVDNVQDILDKISTGDVNNSEISGTPIGVITNWGIDQQKMLQQLFEVGSGLPFFIPGNVSSSLRIGRVVYSGGTLMGTLYNFSSDRISTEDKKDAGFKVGKTGSEWFAINLSAKAFDRPTTLLWVFKNNRDNTWAGSYLFQNAYIQTHSINSDSQSIVIMENATMMFERAVPVSYAQ